MDAIKNYLESMFMNLPNTPEVQKAKRELGQMMEDKYNELISEGKAQNEAVGIVISEFGNLDEIADELGIGAIMEVPAVSDRRMISLAEAREFIDDKAKQAYMVALGVLLCIASPVGTIMFSVVGESVAEALGVLMLFVMIAVGVAMFILSGCTMHKWEFMKHETCGIDYETAKFVHDQKENGHMMYVIMLTVGVMLCILSVVPAAVIGCLSLDNVFLEELSGAMVLLFVGAGVFLIVMSSIRKGGYDRLLSLNENGTIGASYVSGGTVEHYDSNVLRTIMEIYWPTVTCIYLCSSFLTFDWGITWIIWPVAGIIRSLIKSIFGRTDRK